MNLWNNYTLGLKNSEMEIAFCLQITENYIKVPNFIWVIACTSFLGKFYLHIFTGFLLLFNIYGIFLP